MSDLRDIARFCELGADWRDASAHVTPWGVAFTPKDATELNAVFARVCIEVWS